MQEKRSFSIGTRHVTLAGYSRMFFTGLVKNGARGKDVGKKKNIIIKRSMSETTRGRRENGVMMRRYARE